MDHLTLQENLCTAESGLNKKHSLLLLEMLYGPENIEFKEWVTWTV
jgi:hypothetical protein